MRALIFNNKINMLLYFSLLGDILSLKITVISSEHKHVDDDNTYLL